MNILAIESSCDETAVAIVQDGREVLTDCIASQVDLHRIYGGVVPEIASRKHIEAIYGLADQALEKTGLTKKDIDVCTGSDRCSACGREFCQGCGIGDEQTPDSGSPHSGAYRCQLYRLS